MTKEDDKKKKKGMVVVIALGGKPPKSPEHTADPDEKKKMDNAWRFLKEEPTVHPGPYSEYQHDYEIPTEIHPDWDKWVSEVENNPAEYEGVGDDWTQNDMNHLAGSQSREQFFKRMQELSDYQQDDAPIDHENSFRDVPFNDKTSFTMSEPMDAAWSSLLKGE